MPAPIFTEGRPQDAGLAEDDEPCGKFAVKALFIMEYDVPEGQEIAAVTGVLLDNVLVTDAEARPKQVHIVTDLVALKVLSLVKAAR